MKPWKHMLVAMAAFCVGACTSGGGASCSLSSGTQIAATAWPAFRADPVNSGRAPDVDLNDSAGIGTLVFDGRCNVQNFACLVGIAPSQCQAPSNQTCLPIGPVSATPILGSPNIYLASSDGNVYVVAFSRSTLAADISATATSIPLVDSTGFPSPVTPVLGTAFIDNELISYSANDTTNNTLTGATRGTAAVPHQMGALVSAGAQVPLASQMFLSGPIVGSPLLGADGTLFVPSNSRLTQFNADGTAKNAASLSGFISASPNIWGGANGKTDGTVFIGTQSGTFVGVCPNGVNRFVASFPQTQSTAALVPFPNTTPSAQPTPIVIAGGLAGQVRAYTVNGRQYWSFFASATIVASVMIDPLTNLFYVADSSGHVFAADVANGQLDSDFSFTAQAPITASPALGRDDTSTTPPTPGEKMYVADQSGMLYALDRASGEVRWRFQADGPISASPAVATGGTHDVIVLAADILGVVNPDAAPVPIDGKVYAIRDDGDRSTVLWTFDTGHAIGASSPAVGSDGTVYIGRQGARRGFDSECTAQGVASPCLVNDGGALYAIVP